MWQLVEGLFILWELGERLVILWNFVEGRFSAGKLVRDWFLFEYG